ARLHLSLIRNLATPADYLTVARLSDLALTQLTRRPQHSRHLLALLTRARNETSPHNHARPHRKTHPQPTNAARVSQPSPIAGERSNIHSAPQQPCQSRRLFSTPAPAASPHFQSQTACSDQSCSALYRRSSPSNDMQSNETHVASEDPRSRHTFPDRQ